MQKKKIYLLPLILILLASAAFAQAPKRPETNESKKGGGITPQASPPIVNGSGTIGKIPKWTVFSGYNFTLGDSVMAESSGNIGIGTTLPGSKLTVAGFIESLNGGIKFPDGTIQTTSASGSLFSIPHDATLTGNGTAVSPLGVAVPLSLSGAVSGSLVSVTNLSGTGVGVSAIGGNNSASGGAGGDGVSALGGSSFDAVGGSGVSAEGGQSSGVGGKGVKATGGNTLSSLSGGAGVFAIGGDSTLGAGGAGIRAIGGTGPLSDGLAGDFFGGVAVSGHMFVGEDLFVSGMLSKGGGSFKIDHPLDPENRYLYHSFVESPDMKNIYDGVATLDSNGEAVIELPEWFQVLNRDFRYLLTAIGAPMPGLFVGQKVRENRFRIAGGKPGMEVSWQVTGIRQDAWANKNRIKIEVDKSESERGHYLHPGAFDKPEELGIQYSRHPEMMKQRKEARDKGNLPN